nr:helix-turn-helix domain-containing protein [Mycobacterium intracellulare]
MSVYPLICQRHVVDLSPRLRRICAVVGLDASATRRRLRKTGVRHAQAGGTAGGYVYLGDWRVIRGITQPELAAAATISTGSLRGIERGDIALTDANAAGLAALLGITVDEYRAAYPRARQRPPGTTA